MSKKRLLRWAVVAAGVLATFAFVGVAAADVDILNNPGAEDGNAATGATVGISGWTKIDPVTGFVNPGNNCGKTTEVRYGSPNGFPSLGSPGPDDADAGFAFFAGGPNANTGACQKDRYLVQCVDLTGHADEIGHGASYDLSAWLGGFKNQKDRARMEVYFTTGGLSYVNAPPFPAFFAPCAGAPASVYPYGSFPLYPGGGGAALLGADRTNYVTNVDRLGITGLLWRSALNCQGRGVAFFGPACPNNADTFVNPTAPIIPHNASGALVVIHFVHKNGTYNDGYADVINFEYQAHH